MPFEQPHRDPVFLQKLFKNAPLSSGSSKNRVIEEQLCLISSVLWHGLPTMPPARPKVSKNRGRTAPTNTAICPIDHVSPFSQGCTFSALNRRYLSLRAVKHPLIPTAYFLKRPHLPEKNRVRVK